MKFTASFIVSVAGLFACGSALAAAETVYKWTDNRGQVHYSERPPQGAQAEAIKPETGHSEPVTYTTATDEKASEEKKDKEGKKVGSEKSALKDPERCDSARKNLDTLKTYARIKIKGDDGEYRFLTPDEQTQKTAEATKAIEESCD